MFSGIITLTSDLGLEDYYVAAIKGRLLTLDRKVNIVDISHQVASFNSFDGAFILNQAYRYFPEYSLHFLIVSNAHNLNNQFVVAKFGNHYFAGLDDGSFSIIFDEKPEKIHKLKIEKAEFGNSFSLLGAVDTVFRVLNETSFRDFPGVKSEDIVRKYSISGYTENDLICGIVTRIDKFENIITDIHREKFLNIQRGRNFSIELKQHEINKISHRYDDCLAGDLIALFNAQGFLEIAVSKGKAASLFSLRPGSSIKVIFD